MKMKYAILFILGFLCVATTVNASPAKVDRMVAHCACVMEADLCIVDNRPLPPQDINIRGYGKVAAVDYNYIAGPDMCMRIREECTKDFSGPRCMSGRVKFRDNWKGPCEFLKVKDVAK